MSKNTIFDHQNDDLPLPDCTWQLMFSVAGVVLMRSQSVGVQAMGACLATVSLIRMLKKLAACV